MICVVFQINQVLEFSVALSMVENFLGFVFFVSVLKKNRWKLLWYLPNVSLAYGFRRVTWKASCIPFAFIGADRSSLAVTSETIWSMVNGPKIVDEV